jgi:HPt (histidine-containing phosphotransfer) domain-containing protein
MDEFERRMEALRSRFVERAATDEAALRSAWAGRDVETVRRIAHSLAGNAGMFGHPQLSEAAGALEEALTPSFSEEDVARNLDAVFALIPYNSGT